MLSRDNVVLIYQSEIKKFNEMVKAQATIAEACWDFRTYITVKSRTNYEGFEWVNYKECEDDKFWKI